MTAHLPVRRFIPFTKSDLVTMVLTSLRWSDTEHQQLTTLAQLLSDLLHFELHHDLETLKNTYVELNPDRDTQLIFPAKADQQQNQAVFAEKLDKILTAANYDKISQTELKRALATESLVKLQLHVDFNDFEKILFYGRGEHLRQAEIKTWFGLQHKTIHFSRYDRVVIFFQVKDTSYFTDHPAPPGLIPGATLLKLFRNVPKADLEMLFPNTEVRMRLFDKLLIGVPAAVSGSVVITTKLGSTLLLIAAFVSFWLGFRDQPVVIDQTALVALAAGFATLGGFFWRQFSKFKNRKIQFMKTLTDNLYFRNLDNNAGVFYRLTDDAEEEEFKEIFLGYAFLLSESRADQNQTGLSQQTLDEKIEHWFQQSWNTRVDFEIDDALSKLQRMGLVRENNQLLTPVSPSEGIVQLKARWNVREANSSGNSSGNSSELTKQC
jgi:hypothetical protein